ncbi:hypothetical protein WKI40_23085 [Kosakonia sacchari]
MTLEQRVEALEKASKKNEEAVKKSTAGRVVFHAEKFNVLNCIKS